MRTGQEQVGLAPSNPTVRSRNKGPRDDARESAGDEFGDGFGPDLMGDEEDRQRYSPTTQHRSSELVV